jgi:hypothetical protein
VVDHFCRDRDQLLAQGRGAGLRVGERGQRPGGAQQVVGDAGTGQPGTVGGEPTRGQVREGPVDEVGEDLLNEGIRMRR